MAVLVGAPELRDVGVAAQVVQNLHLPPHILDVLAVSAMDIDVISSHRSVPAAVCVIRDVPQLQWVRPSGLAWRHMRTRVAVYKQTQFRRGQTHRSLRLEMDLQASFSPVILSSASRVTPNWPRPSTLPSVYSSVTSCGEAPIIR